MNAQEIQYAIIDLREQLRQMDASAEKRFCKIEAEVFHPGDRIHNIANLASKGRTKEYRALMKKGGL